MKQIAVAILVLITVHLPAGAQGEDASALLGHPRPEERIRGVRLLATDKSSAAIERLIQAVDDPYPIVRAAVRSAPVEIGRPAVVGLLSVLDTQRAPDRVSAANALVNLLFGR